MNALGRLMLCLAGVAVSMIVSILVCINGWGLQPKSWAWIIAANFFGCLLAQLFIECAKSKDD